MRGSLGIGEAAAYLGISRGDLLALYRQDLVPWKSGDGLPRFDTAEIDAFRPRLKQALRRAHAIERRGPNAPPPP
jgi:hypothetical protein